MGLIDQLSYRQAEASRVQDEGLRYSIYWLVNVMTISGTPGGILQWSVTLTRTLSNGILRSLAVRILRRASGILQALVTRALLGIHPGASFNHKEGPMLMLAVTSLASSSCSIAAVCLHGPYQLALVQTSRGLKVLGSGSENLICFAINVGQQKQRGKSADWLLTATTISGTGTLSNGILRSLVVRILRVTIRALLSIHPPTEE